MDKLVLIHLSDIHFTRTSGEVHDLDTNVRNELCRDAARLSNEIGPVAGVLVTGDIAFGGQKAEYKHAADWLGKLCEVVGCPEESVWVVPGNHDVDRELAEDLITSMIHTKIRTEAVGEIDSDIGKFFSNNQSANALLAPLAEFNAFAAPYQCAVSATQPFWERELSLACGTVIRMRGICSVFISNAEDDKGKIILGSAYASVRRDDAVLHLTLCHHPLDWLRDQEAIEDHFNSKVHLQLFGHKHTQRVNVINGKIRLVAGAMHPERREPSWIPTYNVLEISRIDARSVGLRLYQRQWYQPDTCFTANRDRETGREYQEHQWQIDQPTAQRPPSDLPAEPAQPPPVTTNVSSPDSVVRKTEVQPAPDSTRRLTYRFLNLPSIVRYEIALKLGLLREDDEALSRDAVFLEVFKRAVLANQLELLWDETEQHHKDPADQNPFQIPKYTGDHPNA